MLRLCAASQFRCTEHPFGCVHVLGASALVMSAAPVATSDNLQNTESAVVSAVQ